MIGVVVLVIGAALWAMAGTAPRKVRRTRRHRGWFYE